MTVRRQFASLLLLSLPAVIPAQAQGGNTAPAVETILARMAQARNENRARFRPYVVTRDYTLFGKDRSKSKSEVTAEVTFVPPHSKQFHIRRSSGSGLGTKLVRQMLEGETRIVAEYGSTDVSPDNYEFQLAGEETIDNARCYVLDILPKRKHKNLVRGKIWVDGASYLLRRLEGQPAKSPSWWLRNVRIAFTYSDVDGMWLQTASEYTTNVRLFGLHAITSRDVSYDFAELAALPAPGPLPPSDSLEARHCLAPCAPGLSKEIQSGGRPLPRGAR